MKLRVLIVDPSAVVRLMLAEIINAAPDMQVVAVASNEVQARQAIRTDKPDVLLLDPEMPAPGGLPLLADVMRTQPMPALLVAEEGSRNSPAVLRALTQGPIAFAVRPTSASAKGRGQAEELCSRLRIISQRRPAPPPAAAAETAADNGEGGRRLAGLSGSVLTDKVVCIGASTGGTEAIREVLVPLPAEMPPILIVQHMPELFTASFAKRLNNLSRVSVKEAEDGEPIKPGTAYLAPGHSHLSIRKQGGTLVCELSAAPPVNRHRPSVDVLFHSAARMLGSRALGILLTGMGKDGAQGLLAMRQAGAWTVAQDEESCVVWGMPREAIMIGGATEVASLKSIPELLLQRLRQGERRAA